MTSDIFGAQPSFGYIGQGWVGRNSADALVSRGLDVVRYSLEPEFRANAAKLPDCDIVFIAVPTPSTENGLDYSAVTDALGHVGKGKTAVLKSTLTPGTTELLQSAFPDLYILFCPEFLSQATVKHDIEFPNRTIVGLPIMSDAYERRAQALLRFLPKAPYERVMTARDAEVIKIAGNCFLFTKVMFFNLAYDLAQSLNCDWDMVVEAVTNDPRIGASHTKPVHSGGRGAGGACLPKDFEALRQLYASVPQSGEARQLLDALVALNANLLQQTGKDTVIAESVYQRQA